MIRILLVDDHTLFRESLGRLLEAEREVVVAGTCSSTGEAMEALAGSTPGEPVNLVLLDFDLGEEQGSAFLERARASGYGGKVLLVTAGMSDQDTEAAFENGASGLFLKHSPPGQLLEAIHRVMSGEKWLDSRAGAALAALPSDGRTARPAHQPLTPREQSVLKGIFEGLLNKEIAVKLQISESSVKAAIQQLFDKTGVRTRSQLVRIALERHLDR